MGAHPDAQWPKARTDELLRLIDGPYISSGELSRQLRVSRCAVIGKLNRLGLKLKPQPRNPDDPPKRHRGGRPKKLKLPPPPPTPRPVPKPIPIPRSACSLFDLAPGCCHWPVGDPGNVQLYCGAPADGMYCRGHLQLLYQARRPPRGINYKEGRGGGWR